MDLLEALRTAIRSEVNAQKMYQELADQAVDVEVKALFNYLAEYEGIHQQFLEAERRALKAAQQDEEGRPSYWLKLLREEIGMGAKFAAGTDEEADGDLGNMRLNLAAADGIASILRRANNELTKRQQRYERELDIAAEIQRKLLPQSYPINTDLQIAAVNIMARSVGGDYYDFATNDQGQLAVVVADSMGKGIPAALFMTTVRAIWQSLFASGTRWPDQILTNINQALYEDLRATEAFITMFVALYDPATSIFRYSSAGHNPALLRPALTSECQWLTVGGTPIGVLPDPEFPSGEFPLSTGDVAVIYTDGVVEAVNRKGKLFGEQKLCDLMEQNHRSNAESVKDAILSELDSYTEGLPQADDTTVLVLRKI